MEHPETSKVVPRDSNILVFKNTARIEPISALHGWNLINPKASLSETVENKISQVEWLGDLGKKYLPNHVIMLSKNITWTGEPFVLQWAHGHTGDGTALISSVAELRSLQQKFPDRITRRTAFVKGPSFTVNAVVASNKILVGNISYQITGMTPFTDNIFTTVGNDWTLTHSLLDESEIEYIENVVSDIGKKLNIAGWRGLYGVDVIRDDERNTINLIEINARQPASTSFESFLQNQNRVAGVDGLTTFEAHLKALLNEPIEKPLIPINDGAQIIQRVTRTVRDIKATSIDSLKSTGYNLITYPNTQYNTDLIRIQSSRGIMETHGNFNERGKEIVKIL
jgi:predicted ATP-grasp superfamily ATP-dependent carboligase